MFSRKLPADNAVIFWVKSYNVTGQPKVFSVAAINIIPLGVSVTLHRQQR